MKNPDLTLFRILFYQEKKRIELYARGVGASADMMGFVLIDDIVFNETSGSIIDAAEEKLKAEFGDVKCCYLNYHDVIRIDKVKKSGIPKIVDVQQEGPGTLIRPSAFHSGVLPVSPSE